MRPLQLRRQVHYLKVVDRKSSKLFFVTGIAATLLYRGRTAHSTLKIPLNAHLQTTPMCNISKQTSLAARLRLAKLIILDECSMMHKKSVEAVDNVLRDIRTRPDEVMGGVLFILSGDFRQILPVISKGTPADEIWACLKSSYLWKEVKTLRLKTNMRIKLASGDMDYDKKLLAIGGGTMGSGNGKILLSHTSCVRVESVDELIDAVYPTIGQNYENSVWLRDRTILAPLNNMVDDINGKILNRLPGISTTYTSVDMAIEDNDSEHFPIEFLNTLTPAGFPPHLLQLKLGATIICLRNINGRVLVNGTRLRVTRLMPNLIQGEILNGANMGDLAVIPRIPMDTQDFYVKFRRLQFPIKLAFCMTINKSQGQSIKICGVSLKENVFSHGQLYVAFSRVGNPQRLTVFSETDETQNIVYKGIL